MILDFSGLSVGWLLGLLVGWVIELIGLLGLLGLLGGVFRFLTLLEGSLIRGFNHDRRWREVPKGSASKT